MKLPHRTVLCACYVDLDEADGTETVMGLIVDISEQKWIEEQLLERTKKLEDSETRYRTLADLSPLGIVSTDRSPTHSIRERCMARLLWIQERTGYGCTAMASIHMRRAFAESQAVLPGSTNKERPSHSRAALEPEILHSGRRQSIETRYMDISDRRSRVFGK